MINLGMAKRQQSEGCFQRPLWAIEDRTQRETQYRVEVLCADGNGVMDGLGERASWWLVADLADDIAMSIAHDMEADQ